MIAYVDTSVLVKLVVDEPGSGAAAEIWDEADVVGAVRIGLVEARAALAAARRAGRLTARQLGAAKNALSGLWSQLVVVEVTEALALGAGDLAETASLRGYDAVHLAGAIALEADVVATAGRELAEAASSLGFHTAGTS